MANVLSSNISSIRNAHRIKTNVHLYQLMETLGIVSCYELMLPDSISKSKKIATGMGNIAWHTIVIEYSRNTKHWLSKTMGVENYYLLVFCNCWSTLTF